MASHLSPGIMWRGVAGGGRRSEFRSSTSGHRGRALSAGKSRRNVQKVHTPQHFPEALSIKRLRVSRLSDLLWKTGSHIWRRARGEFCRIRAGATAFTQLPPVVGRYQCRKHVRLPVCMECVPRAPALTAAVIKQDGPLPTGSI